MKLIVVTPRFWTETGVGDAVKQLTLELMELGVELVTVMHGDSYEGTDARNLDVHARIPAIPIGIKDNFFLRPFENYLFSKKAAKLLKLRQNDFGDDCVIHSHSLYPSALLGSDCRKMNAVFVTTIHGSIAGELHRLRKEIPVHPQELRYRFYIHAGSYVSRVLIRRSKGQIIALSLENLGRFVNLGFPQSRIHVIPNGVDLNFFKPDDRDEARKKLSLPIEKQIVLTISYIEPRKGLHKLIEAARRVIKEEPDAYFVIVGPVRKAHMWYITYLKQLLSKFGLNRHFKFMGFVPKELLPVYMNAADMFALPSYAEGAPLVVPQAMACRRVVIASENAAAGYLPQNLIVQTGNLDELAQKISFYLLNTKKRELVGKELYKKAINEFSWANIARKTLDLYRKIMANCSA